VVARGALRSGGIHLQLAKAVLTGKLRHCAWDALKALYFKGSTDQACMDKLVAWAKRHGIEIEPEELRLEVAGKVVPAWRVHLRPRPDR
jgi:hypothetical protein